VNARAWERRHAFLIGLAGAAGSLDALTFIYLGKVFASFQSGNVLFLGIGAGEPNGGLVVRAATVLVAFTIGTAAGARLVGVRLSPDAPPRAELRIVGVEAALLALFAVVWLAIGNPTDHAVLRVVLLALGGAAMGIQVALAMALHIPNIVTVAVTATLARLGQLAGARPRTHDADEPSTSLLAGLPATYAACALVVALLPAEPALALAPVVLLTAGVVIDVVQERPAKLGRAAA
jgi:uncharacterized membrane protein YoaK (UPF0700 family)